MARIQLDNVSHSYDPASVPEGSKHYAVNDLQISWEDGSANALLGPSGCGKTTMLNIISGLLRPSHGRVLFGDQDVTTLSPRQRRIAQVFQFPVVYDSMNVFDNLAFPLRNQAMPEKQVREKVTEVAEILDLTHMLKASASALNAADKQKISLGRGIVREDTAAVLLDEPLTIIDPKLKGSLRRKLREVQRNLQKTMIYVTHDQHEALTFADQVTIIKDGALVQNGTPEELHSEPATPFIGYFIGSPGMNILDCALSQDALVGAGFRLPVSSELQNRLQAYPGQLQLGIRPEYVQVASEKAPEGMPFQVTVIESTGAYLVVTFEQDQTRVKARVPESQVLSEGQTAWLLFPEDKINIFQAQARII